MKHFSLFLLLFCLFSAAQAQVEINYCDDSLTKGYGNADELFTPYMQMPAQLIEPYAGNAITAVKIGLLEDVTNVTIYIKNAPQDQQPLYTQKVGELAAGWNTIELTTPFTIEADGEPLSIGYRARSTKDNALGYCSLRNAFGNLVYINGESKWSTINGTFSIKALVEGDQMPAIDLAIGALADQRIDAVQESFRLTSTVRNMGIQPISSYTISCKIDDIEAEPFSFEREIAINATDTFELDMPVMFGLGKHSISLEITEVNGQPDAVSTNNYTSATIVVPDERFTRRVVCEEFTGNWCGWCPRGMVGLELMTELYPDTFIPVAVHGGSNDPLETPADAAYTYQPFIESFTGAPNCSVNRRLKGDPYYDIGNIYYMESIAENHVACSMTARWNELGDAIDLEITGITDEDYEKANFNAAFILLEDSITGVIQANYYAGESDEFYGWEKKPDYVKDLVYDNIARGCFPTFEGTNVVLGKLDAGQEFSLEYSLPIPAEVANPRQLHVVGIIIDASNGFIQNACHLWPEAYNPQSIRRVLQPQQGTRYFDLQGRPVAHPAPGQLLIHIDR